MRIVCQIIAYFIRKFGKMSQNLSSAAVMIGALRVKRTLINRQFDKKGLKDMWQLTAGQ